MTAPADCPIYLVELFCLTEGGLEWADISGNLALSLEAVYWHLLTFDEKVTVTVSEDSSQSLEGIAFLRADESLLATVTVYRLDRERGDESEHVKALHAAAQLKSGSQLQDALARLF